MVWQPYLAYTAKAGPGGRRLTRRSASRRQRHHTGENGGSPYCDTGNRTSRGEIGLSKFGMRGNGITVKSIRREKYVIDVGPVESLKLGFCEENFI